MRGPDKRFFFFFSLISFFLGPLRAHAVCPSHLGIDGIIKNHQPINFLGFCFVRPNTRPRPERFFGRQFSRLLIGFLFFIFYAGAPLELTPRDVQPVDHLWFVCGFRVDLHSRPCDEGVCLLRALREIFFLPVCGCSPFYLTNLHRETRADRIFCVCGACYVRCEPPHLSISISPACVLNNPLTC